MRQESFFNPRAQSPAGALGLSQVLPSTGRSIAADLNLLDFSVDQLLHAELNLRFGAYYLAEQLGSFDAELYLAFAAYNADPAQQIAGARHQGRLTAISSSRRSNSEKPNSILSLSPRITRFTAISTLGSPRQACQIDTKRQPA